MFPPTRTGLLLLHAMLFHKLARCPLMLLLLEGAELAEQIE